MNTIGHIFRISIFGESHGAGIGVVIDGIPAGIELQESDFTYDLSRRQSGAKGTTPRKEPDLPLIQSGIFNGYTTGAPLTVFFKNENAKSSDYEHSKDIPRPGHADFTALAKYRGFADYRGGGHFSGRLTLALVAAGVVAKKIIHPITIEAKLIQAGGEKDIESAVDKAIQNHDSIGGIIQCVATHIPVGLGEPFFNSIESVISQLIFSIPAVKGIEFGSGFEAANMTGSKHNDAILSADGKTTTNHAGGILGGISNGNDIIFRIAIKPTSSIGLPQHTINLKTGNVETLQIEGRHDACIALRVPVVAEAATAIALADLLMLHNATNSIVHPYNDKKV